MVTNDDPDAQLAGSIPTEIKGWTQIRRVNITGNAFSNSLANDLFTEWKQAVAIDISNNGLPGEIPASIGNMTNCTSFLAKNNQLSGFVPTEIKNLVKLERFDISGNDIVGRIGQGMCAVMETVPTVTTVDCDKVTCDCCDPAC